MPSLGYGLLILIGLAALVLLRVVTIREYEQGLLLRRGKAHRLLTPGRHLTIYGLDQVLRVDTRWRWFVLSGQELLSADTVNFKMSLIAQYRVADIRRALLTVENYQEALYLLLQAQLREVMGTYTLDDILAKRADLIREVYQRSAPLAENLGLELADLRLRDLMLAGEVKSLYLATVRARKEGQAVLERARGETAALRNLLNAVQLLEEHPRLWALRVLQALSEGNHSLVLRLDGDEDLPQKS